MKTKLLNLSVFCASLFSAYSQPASWQWAESAGGIYDDYGSAVCADASGNIYVAGNFNNDTLSFGNVHLPNNGQEDFFIAKYSASGSFVWARSWGGPAMDGVSSIAADNAGKLFITGAFGSTFSFGGIPLTSMGGADIFVASLDTAGNITWATAWGGYDEDWPATVKVNANGNVFVNGSFDSPYFIAGVDTLPNYTLNGWSDLFLAKLNSGGTVSWIKGIHGPDEDGANDLDLDALTGDILITGYYNSDSVFFDTLKIYNPQNGNMFVAKYNTNGDALWAKTFGGAGNVDYPYGIETDHSGNSYLTGFFYSDTIRFDHIALARDGDANLFLAKMDPFGNAIWATTSHGAGSTFGYHIAVDPLQDVYLTGDFDGPSVHIGNDSLLNPNPGPNSKALLVAKFGSSGNLKWMKGGGIPANYAFGICADPNMPGDVFVTGAFTNSFLAFDSDTVYAAGGLDMFVARLSSLSTGIVKNHLEAGIKFYPNPVIDQLYIETEQPAHFIIYNVQGQLAGECYSNRAIDVSYLSDGLYFMKSETAAFRFVKTH